MWRIEAFSRGPIVSASSKHVAPSDGSARASLLRRRRNGFVQSGLCEVASRGARTCAPATSHNPPDSSWSESALERPTPSSARRKKGPCRPRSASETARTEAENWGLSKASPHRGAAFTGRHTPGRNKLDGPIGQASGKSCFVPDIPAISMMAVLQRFCLSTESKNFFHIPAPHFRATWTVQFVAWGTKRV